MFGHPVRIGINNGLLRVSAAMGKDGGRKSDTEQDTGAHCIVDLTREIQKRSKKSRLVRCSYNKAIDVGRSRL